MSKVTIIGRIKKLMTKAPDNVMKEAYGGAGFKNTPRLIDTRPGAINIMNHGEVLTTKKDVKDK